MKIFVVGGTGFIGNNLISALLRKGHEIHALLRSNKKANFPSQVSVVKGDGIVEGAWQKKIGEVDTVINVAGSPIQPPWTNEMKNSIYRSRVETTRNIAMAMNNSQLLLTASAIGYYGFREDEILDESASCGDDFLATVCRDWEARSRNASCRVIIARMGIVLGYGGMLEQMVKMLKHFVGSRLGSGKQWFSWIHMEDLVKAMIFCLDNNTGNDVYNISSPNPVRNQDLMQYLMKLSGKTSALPVPAAFLKLALGEFANIILRGQRVHPARLLEKGFQFQYPQLPQALEDLLKKLVI